MIQYEAIKKESRYAGEKTLIVDEVPTTMVLFLEYPHIPTDRTMNTIFIFTGEDKALTGRLIFDVLFAERRLEIVNLPEDAANLLVPPLLWVEQLAKGFGLSEIILPQGPAAAEDENRLALYKRMGYELPSEAAPPPGGFIKHL